MESIYLRLGHRIRAARERLGLTQELLAEKAHLSTAFIGQIERGQNTASLGSLDKISRALDLSLSELFRAAKKGSYKLPSSQQKILSLLRERPSREQEYIVATVKALVRRLSGAPKKSYRK